MVKQETASTMTERFRWLENASLFTLCAFVASTQFSIAIAESFLALTFIGWLALLIANRERFEAPAIFTPLVVYAALTLVCAVALSPSPRSSLHSAKQLTLFMTVPLVYRLARGDRAKTLLHIIITIGALSALFGIVQYGILGYDNLHRRVEGTLGHYMTYSGLLMLVVAATTARLTFGRRENRIWPALILPALIIAIMVSFTRSAWIGTCAAIALLFALKNIRLVAAVPVVIAAVLAVVIAIAPSALVGRFYSVVNLKDPTSSDRISMLQAGVHIVRDHPLTGVGLDNIKKVYPQYRVPGAIEPIQPHLHNVPMQIAAERGLPALGVWIWFIVTLVVGAFRQFRSGGNRVLAAGALAAVAGMLTAGLFEYNFGDSEFLMLFLALVTLPFAAENRSGLFFQRPGSRK